MGFGSSLQTGSSTTTEIQDPIYLKLIDERVIRILDKEEYVYWRYFMNVNVNGKRDGRPIVVGEVNGPVKQHMDKIGKEDKEWRAVNKRMLLNVLDRTPVKKTSHGIAVYADGRGVFPKTDPATGEDITQAPVEPNNKVMVIDFGPDLMKQFMTYHERVRHNKTFDPLPVWAFDLRIVTTSNPKDRKDVNRVAMPDVDQEPLPTDLSGLLKYDLSKLVRPMPPEYQIRLLNGDDYVAIIKEIGWERPTPTVRQ